MGFRKHSTNDFKPSDGKFIKWEKVGMTVEGTWEGTQISSFKDQKTGEHKIEALVLVDSEPKVMPLTKALMNFFEGAFGGVHKVPVGAAFRITFTGTIKVANQPSPMKVFDVEFDEAAFPQDQEGF